MTAAPAADRTEHKSASTDHERNRRNKMTAALRPPLEAAFAGARSRRPKLGQLWAAISVVHRRPDGTYTGERAAVKIMGRRRSRSTALRKHLSALIASTPIPKSVSSRYRITVVPMPKLLGPNDLEIAHQMFRLLVNSCVRERHLVHEPKRSEPARARHARARQFPPFASRRSFMSPPAAAH